MRTGVLQPFVPGLSVPAGPAGSKPGGTRAGFMLGNQPADTAMRPKGGSSVQPFTGWRGALYIFV
ncbi:MAG TPA: hypothetical protein VN673_02240, partial [Clostridia bacterium]|nr:hypothetical protein [Clostridia bacterium]